MLALPWSSQDEENPKKLLKEEVTRQLKIMSKNEPGSQEYQQALSRYKELHDHMLKETKIKEHRKSRWFDAGITGLLAIATLTAEQWTPLTSKWIGSITHPFHSKDNLDIDL